MANSKTAAGFIALFACVTAGCDASAWTLRETLKPGVTYCATERDFDALADGFASRELAHTARLLRGKCRYTFERDTRYTLLSVERSGKVRVKFHNRHAAEVEAWTFVEAVKK